MRPLRQAPWPVLAALLVCQWAALGAFAATVRHNGWLFYQGGDETRFYTAAWAVANGHVPSAAVGYGWSYLIAPLAGLAGPNFLNGLPALLLLQVALLAPVALYCVYAIAARIGGRTIGYVAAALWVVAPYLAIPLWDHSYHAKYVEQFLPQAFGLTGLADYPSLVCLLVAALFCIRALDSGDPVDAVLAGLVAGFAIGIKPANALFLAGPFLAFLAARRIPLFAGFGAALVPAVLALALWKYRGLGHVPILGQTQGDMETRLASGGPFAAPLGSDYLDLSWAQFQRNYVDLRDLFFAVPVLQAIPILGFVAALRRSVPKALVLGGWLAAFVIVKGSSPEASLDGGTLLRLFMPGFPPLLILSALAPLLVLGGRLAPSHEPTSPHRLRTTAIVAVVLAFVPLLLFAVLPPLRNHTAVSYAAENVNVPVDKHFSLRLRRQGKDFLLTWRRPSSSGSRSFVKVLRSYASAPAPNPGAPPAHDGIRCHNRPAGYAAAGDCWLEMAPIATTRADSFVDSPPRGHWVYRVALMANWRDDLNAGDVLLVSNPVRADR